MASVLSFKEICKYKNMASASSATFENLLSEEIPGTDSYMKTYILRYIMVGGSFPEEYIIEFMKNIIYPTMFGKKMFPGFGPTVLDNEQETRRQKLKQVVGI